jgi:hypothetical protein
MLHVFRRDIQRLRDLVTAISVEPASRFFLAASVSFGIAVPAVFGLIGYYTTKPRPLLYQSIVYWILAAAGLSLAVGLMIAGRVLREEHSSGKSLALNEIDRIEYSSPVVADPTEAKP